MPNAKPTGVACEDKVRAAITTAKNAKSVRVLLGEEEVKRIALAESSRRRATIFLETLKKCGAWSSLDLLDKRGETIEIVTNDDEPSGLEELGAGVRSSGELAKYDAIFKIAADTVLRTHRESLAFRSRETAEMQQSIAQVVKELTAAIHTLNEAHATERESLLEVADHRAELAERSGRDWAEQLSEALEAAGEAAPHLGPMIGMLRMAIKGPPKTTPAAKPNGANGASASSSSSSPPASPPKGD